MAVTMASAKKVRRQKILKNFLLECSCRSVVSCCAVARVRSRLSNEMLFVYEELSTENCPPLLAVTFSQLAIGGLLKHTPDYTYNWLYKDTKRN
jgi:hypothetical protein